jgi:hypothetical protein
MEVVFLVLFSAIPKAGRTGTSLPPKFTAAHHAAEVAIIIDIIYFMGNYGN